METEQEKFQRQLDTALAAIRKAIKALSEGDDNMKPLMRATDRAYRAARYLGPEASDAISSARVGIEAALEAGHQVRVNALRAEARKLRDEQREAELRSPTRWMRA